MSVGTRAVEGSPERPTEQDRGLSAGTPGAAGARGTGALGEPGTAAADACGAPAIAAQNLGKCYEIYARPIDRLKQTLWRGRRQFYRPFWALRDVSFEVAPGESFGIIGRNGSGKSTLLQIIAGTLRPTSGQVRVRGRVHALLELGSGFNPEFTGRENVFLNGAVLGLSPAEVAAHFDEIAAFADIGDFLDLPVKTYSTGMAVRLAFAVQAQLEPDVLIVDEALAVGDAPFQAKCFRRIHQLRERGTTILLVSHDIMNVSTMCQRALLLEGGAAVMLGAAREVTQEYYRRIQEAELRTSAPAEGGGQAPPPSDDQGPGQVESAGRLADTLEPVAGTRGLRQGDGQAEIFGFAVYDHERRRRLALEAREPFRIDVGVRFLADLANPTVGVALRDVRNQLMLGGHTLWEGLRLGPVKAGERLVASFEMVMSLNPGKYLLMLAVSDHAAFFSWTENDVIFDHCVIDVYGERRAWCLVNMPARITVHRDHQSPSASEGPANGARSASEGLADRARSASEGLADRARSASEGAADRARSASEGLANGTRNANESPSPPAAPHRTPGGQSPPYTGHT